MGTSASRAVMAHLRTIAAAAAAFALTLGLAPSLLFAEELEPAGAPASVAVGSAPTASKGSSEAATPTSAEAATSGSASVDPVAASFVLAAGEGSAAGATPNSSTLVGNNGSVLASALADSTSAVLSADVALNSAEPLIGSFTVDGLTYSVASDGLTLVSVDPAAVSDGFVSIPASATYNGTTYPVTSIAPYAFYLSGVTQAEFPASISSVDDRAFRSSDVERVGVAADNPNYASFDGALYSVDLHRLLLIPEGRAGAVLLPSEAEVAEASKFSHCSLVEAISVEEGGANFASWEGLLYDASGQTLLRVPAGATEITIRDGCTTIAAGALEGCASLERINAPASVTAISPDVFTSIPTIALPVQTALRDEENPGVASSLLGQVNDSTNFIPQITAMVALSTIDNDLPEVDPATVEVVLPEGFGVSLWQRAGMTAQLSSAESVNASGSYSVQVFNHTGVTLQWQMSGVTRSDPFMPGQKVGISLIQTLHRQSNGIMLDGANTWLWLTQAPVYIDDASEPWLGTSLALTRNISLYLGQPRQLLVKWELDAPDGLSASIETTQEYIDYNTPAKAPIPSFANGSYIFLGWFDEDGTEICEAGGLTPPIVQKEAFYGRWKYVSVDISFDTSSEPDDKNYPGNEKPNQTVTGDQIASGGNVPIEDPRRPGYVFQGWVIPNAEGTEAVDQELVYQDEADGKWYVDASKLPDYAGDDGRVELTARWTSVISVDVPQSVTFYADTVTQNQGSREGAASSAFGQNKVANQSQVDLRVVGLESEAVKTTDATLGADSILKKAEAATPSTSAGKLLSLYPSTKQWTADELQDPEAVGGTKDATAVDFDLDDILLETSFAADAFTIEAGRTLSMGYRLNLTETGQQLDYDRLSTLEDGQSAAIANVSYCFAADYGMPFWTTDDDGSTLNVFAIKADAEKIAAGDATTTDKYTRWMNADHRFYVKWYDQGKAEAQDPDAATVYGVRIIGINHDDKSDGSGKAGLTFQFVNSLKDAHRINATNVATGMWPTSELRARMNPGTQSVTSGTDNNVIWNQIPKRLGDLLATVNKTCWTGASYTDPSTRIVADRLFLPSEAEVRKVSTYPTYAPYYNQSIALEGSLYGFFQDAPNGYVAWNKCRKRLGDTGSYECWWMRSHSSNPDNMASTFMIFGTDGSASHADRAASPYGISPAFCL